MRVRQVSVPVAAVGIQAVLVGYAVSVLFISAQYQKLFWLMVFLSVCMQSLAQKVAPEKALEGEHVEADSGFLSAK